MTNNTKGHIKAGLTGAVIGAGIAAAATKFLSDEKNREKISDVIGRIKKKANGRIVDAKKEVKQAGEKVGQKLEGKSGK